MRFIPALILAACLAACIPQPSRSDSAAPAVPPTGPREVVGILPGETHLEGEIIVTGDILVPREAVLVIHPGTVVRVQPSDSTKIDPEYLSAATEILVRGSLRVLGSAERPVRFLPHGPSESGDYAWAGIAFDRAGTSEISQAEIIGAETGLLCIGSSPEIRSVRIAGSRYGLVAQDGSAPRVTDSRIEKGEGGIFCWRGSHPHLRGTRIAEHDEEGVFVDRSSRPVIEGNVITGNAIGLALYPRDLPFDPSQVRENREDVRFLGPGGKQ